MPFVIQNKLKPTWTSLFFIDCDWYVRHDSILC